MQQINGLIPTLISSIPVWAILLFYIFRTTKNRDAFEKDIDISLKKLNSNIYGHSTVLALIKNDLENLKETIKSVNLIVPNLEKFKTDLDLYYKRLRELERKADV